MIALGNSGTVGDDVGLIEAVGLLEYPEADVADLSTVASNCKYLFSYLSFFENKSINLTS